MKTGRSKSGRNLDAIMEKLDPSRPPRKPKEDKPLLRPSCYEDFLKIAKLVR